ncbi:MAG: hypothetical protein JXA67_16180 [Micromonosporaceae bacterium]|nr:hypothetical protein [Micromonosporaceae bacterium]
MNRRIVAVLSSIALALVGTGAVFMYVRSADARAIAGKQARTVVVADKRIPAGTTGRVLKSGGYLRAVTMPRETLPEDALETIGGDLEDLAVTAEVQRGQLLLRAMLGKGASGAGGLSIPDGMVAVAARVKASTFGPGTVTVGSKVAVFYTYTPLDETHRNSVAGAGLEKQHVTNNVTRLLLNEVEVIAVGQQGAQAAQAKSATSDDTVMITLALVQKQAERLAHAVAIGGELNIALVSESSGVKADQGVDNRTLFQ